MLSIGGKEVLIKVVLQAIPMYAMSCFLLSSYFCKELKSVIARFWWQKSAGKRFFIGVLGILCVYLKEKEVWAFEIWASSTSLSLPNKAGS